MSYESVFEGLCRVCLRHSDPAAMTPLVLTDRLTDHGHAVLVFAKVTISPTDKLPNKICAHCLVLLKQAILLKTTCERNHHQLRRLAREARDSDLKTSIVQYSMFRHYLPDVGFKHLDEDSDQERDGAKVGQERLKQVKDVSDKGACAENPTEFLEVLIDTFKTDDSKAGEPARMSSSERYECVMCKEKFADKSTLSVHVKQHNNNLKPTISPEDATEFLEVMLDTDETADPSAERISSGGCYTCDICSKVFDTKRAFSSHMTRHGSGREEKSEAADTEELEVADEAGGARAATECTICSKTFTNKACLRAHVQRHVGAGVVCEHCGRTFKTKAEYKFHAMSRHGAPRAYSCPHCDFKGKVRNNVREHIRKAHTGERPFVCDVCGGKFFSRQVLVMHSVIHGEKRFKCAHCPRSFFTQRDLSAHTNSMHERRYMYRCGVPSCQLLYGNCGTVRKHLASAHNIPRDQQGPVERVKV